MSNTTYNFQTYLSDGRVRLHTSLFDTQSKDYDIVSQSGFLFTAEQTIDLIVSLEAVLSELLTGEEVNASTKVDTYLDRVRQFKYAKEAK